ncbi:MAG: hypothetical protein II670_00845 [Alphaproteobacteria bacterium]|nr:hypothetical protein [Alphaproteobacteria bacterium]
MALEIKVNLNDDVWVELTDYGWETIESYFDNLFSYVPGNNSRLIEDSMNLYKRETKQYWVDKVGGEKIFLTKFQIHDLMNLLGPKTCTGNTSCIKDNTLYFTISNFIESYETEDTQSDS